MKRVMLSVLFLAIILVVLPKGASAAQAWAVIDADTGRLLDGNNENSKLPIASLTKVWTAFTFLESGVPEGKVSISPQAASAEGSSLYLKQGMTVHTDDLLYGLMLRSGNDAAYALAEHAGGSVEGFVNLMNEKALLYGLEHTVFTNPSGLPDESHLSTAYETALMMFYGMGNEKFRQIATTKHHVYNGEETIYSWQNKHRLLHSEPTAIAGKTGFTKAAGRTLVTYFEKDGKNIIVVTLNDGNDWNTHKELAYKTFSTFKRVTIAKKGMYEILPGIHAELDEPIRILLRKGEKAQLSNVVSIPRGNSKRSMGIWSVNLDHEPLVTREVILTR